MKKAGERPHKRISLLEDGCYVCRRIEFHFNNMIETAVFLWDEDEDFRAKFSAQPYFCLPHYRALLDDGLKRFGKKKVAPFRALPERKAIVLISLKQG